jgi:hypothetical protein
MPRPAQEEIRKTGTPWQAFNVDTPKSHANMAFLIARWPL